MLVEAPLCFVIAWFVKPDLFLGQKIQCTHFSTKYKAGKEKTGMYEQDTEGQGKRK